MRISKLTAVILAAIAGMQCLTGCSKKKSSDMPLYAETAVNTTTAPAVGGAELSGDNYNSEEYKEKLSDYINSTEIDDSELVLGTVGDELISPDKDSKEFELGDYRISSSGIKLYYDETEFPAELMLTLEKYFVSFANADYETYHKCLLPGYTAEMDAVKDEKDGRDIKSAFINQCSSLADNMQGDFKITRIKLEKAEPRTDGVDNIEGYFQMINNYLGKDYYSEVKEQCDDILDACFYLMGEDSYGNENIIVSKYKIVFAVKDGRYYTFG